MAVNTTTIAYALKRLYPQSRLENLVYQDNPLLAMIPKQGGFGGSVTAIAVRYADSVAESADFATAQGASQAGAGGYNKGVQFLVTRAKAYQFYNIDTESILAAENDSEAFVRTLDTEVSSALNNFGRARSIDLYRDGVGERGQIGAIAGTLITLANINDITNFEVGRTVVVSAGATKTAALRNSGTGTIITGVDRDLGTITVAANTDSAVANDWLFFKGDRTATYTSPLRIIGMEGWNPGVAPVPGDNFYSVDRSVDASRLAGLRIDISSMNPEEGLVTAMNRLAREGGRPSHLFLNFADLRNIQVALGSKAICEYTKVGEIGFQGIRVTGPKGDVMLYADQNAPSGVGRLVQMDTWSLRYMKELAYIQDMDGARLSRQVNADAWEGRIAFYGQLTCTGPGRNARLVMPT